MDGTLPPDIQAAREALDEGLAWQARERERRIGAYHVAVGLTLLALAAAFVPFMAESFWEGRGGTRLRFLLAACAAVVGVAFWQRRRAFRRLALDPDELWGVTAWERWGVLALTAGAVGVAVLGFSRPSLVLPLAVLGGALLLALQALRARDLAHGLLALALALLAWLFSTWGSAWGVVLGVAAFGAASAIIGWRRLRSLA